MENNNIKNILKVTLAPVFETYGLLLSRIHVQKANGEPPRPFMVRLYTEYDYKTRPAPQPTISTQKPQQKPPVQSLTSRQPQQTAPGKIVTTTSTNNKVALVKKNPPPPNAPPIRGAK